jgi:signal transduction histidine kinase
LFSLAFLLVAAITQPSTAAALILAAVPIAAFALWAFVPTVPLAAASLAIVVPTVLVQESGHLEPVMFNVCLLSFAASRWLPSVGAAASLGALAAASPVLVALIQDPAEVAVGIWIVAVAFTWVCGRAVARQERLVLQLAGTRRQLAEQAFHAERRRIARDVHDFVGHGLAGMMLQVTSARHVLRRDADAAEEALRSAEEVGRHSMQELRRTVALLREDEVGVATPVPNAIEIPALVDQARDGGLAVELRTQGDLSRIPPGVGLALYRIVPEALAHAARQAPNARTMLGLELETGRGAFGSPSRWSISTRHSGIWRVPACPKSRHVRSTVEAFCRSSRGATISPKLSIGTRLPGWRGPICRRPNRANRDVAVNTPCHLVNAESFMRQFQQHTILSTCGHAFRSVGTSIK